MFSGFFVLVVGVVMIVCTSLGIRHGRVMTMGKSETANAAKWAARGEPEFVPYTLIWMLGGLFLCYQGIRLMVIA